MARLLRTAAGAEPALRRRPASGGCPAYACTPASDSGYTAWRLQRAVYPDTQNDVQGGSTFLIDMPGIHYTRTYFSRQHLEAAVLCARHAHAFEVAHAGQVTFLSEHRSHVVGAVLFSVACLEAAANEFFADAAEGTLSRLRPLDEKTVARLAELWKAGVPRTARYTVTEKYSIALALADRPPFDRGSDPWQSAVLLTRLRNALTHYEPEWVPAASVGAVAPHQFERALRGKFAINPLAADSLPFYPDKVLGFGCAAWAIFTTSRFIAEFSERLELLTPLVGSHGVDLITA